MLDALLAGRIGQAHAVPLETEALEVEPEPVARLTDEQRDAIAYGVLLCDATAGMANDRATIDGASRAADVLRGLLRHPQPTLTDEERDVLDRLAHDASYRRMEWTERVLRGVLKRLG